MSITLRSVGFLLACGMLVFSSCSQDKDLPQATEAVQKHYQQLRVELSAEAVQQAFKVAQTARGIDYSLDPVGNSAPGRLKKPMIKNIDESTSVIAVVRSSNAEQPVNYFRLKLQKKADAPGDTIYQIVQANPLADASGKPTAGGGDVQPENHAGQTLSFDYDESKDLGTLSMMLIVGGEWNASAQTVSFKSSVVPVTTEGGQRVAKGLDVPYLSEWVDLTIENKSRDYMKLRRDEAIRLKPQGILLDMQVENEMGEPNQPALSRNVILKGFTIRSSAYSGAGTYTFSDAAVKSTSAYAPAWTFEGYEDGYDATTGDLLTSDFRLATPLEVGYSSQGRVLIDDVRKLYAYPNSPHVLTWVMPTETPQALASAGSEIVRTQILADVEDTRVAGGNTVFSNDPNVDALEAQGKIVVPKMTALPVYASKKLATKNGGDADFVQGTSYRMTLNLSRFPMQAELISQYEVNADGTGFVNDSYQNVGYFPYTANTNASEFSNTVKFGNAKLNSGTNGKASWSNVTFEKGALMFAGSTASKQGTILNTSPVGRSVRVDRGTYYADNGNSLRVSLLYTYRIDDLTAEGGYAGYSVVGYPPSSTGNGDIRGLQGGYIQLLRYEIVTLTSGMKAMKVTSRFIGPASLELGYIPRGSVAMGSMGTWGATELKNLLSDVNAIQSYWNDPVRKEDDVVRYFPFLGEAPFGVTNPTQAQLTDYGVRNEFAIGVGYTDFSTAGVAYWFYASTGNTSATNATSPRYYRSQMNLPFRLFRWTLDTATK